MLTWLEEHAPAGLREMVFALAFEFTGTSGELPAVAERLQSWRRWRRLTLTLRSAADARRQR